MQNPMLDIGKQGLKAASFMVPGSGLGTFLASGALYGAGSSDANDPQGIARDAAGGAAAGLAGGAVLKTAGKLVKPVANWAADKSLTLGRKALSGIGTALAAKKPISPAAVEQAYASGAIRPLSTVAGIAERLGVTADELGAEYGQILANLEAKGVHGPEAQALAAELTARAQQVANNSVLGVRSGALQDAATSLESKALPISGKGRLGLMQAELMKRELQTAAKNDFVREGKDSLAGAARKELAGTWKDAIEQAVSDQAGLAPAEAAAFEPVKAKLAATLEARTAAETGAARAARRKAISLTDTIAGSAAGAATHNPVVGVGGALLHGLLDRRLASTGGYAARHAARGLNWLDSVTAPGLAGAAAAPASPEVQALVEALRARFGGPRVGFPVAADEETPTR
jgi:hypothetical protein